jgi:hypothetical protein
LVERVSGIHDAIQKLLQQQQQKQEEAVSKWFKGNTHQVVSHFWYSSNGM